MKRKETSFGIGKMILCDLLWARDRDSGKYMRLYGNLCFNELLWLGVCVCVTVSEWHWSIILNYQSYDWLTLEFLNYRAMIGLLLNFWIIRAMIGLLLKFLIIQSYDWFTFEFLNYQSFMIDLLLNYQSYDWFTFEFLNYRGVIGFYYD